MRDYMIFIFGINTGLRISDILKLKVGDVRNKSHIHLVEQKSGKHARFKINGMLYQELANYMERMYDEQYLFKSREGWNKPLSRSQAHRILHETAAQVGLPEIGTHSLRKTFGYHFYQQTRDIGLLQKIFNHASPSMTMRYIGITQDMIDHAMVDFVL